MLKQQDVYAFQLYTRQHNLCFKFPQDEGSTQHMLIHVAHTVCFLALHKEGTSHQGALLEQRAFTRLGELPRQSTDCTPITSVCATTEQLSPGRGMVQQTWHVFPLAVHMAMKQAPPKSCGNQENHNTMDDDRRRNNCFPATTTRGERCDGNTETTTQPFTNGQHRSHQPCTS